MSDAVTQSSSPIDIDQEATLSQLLTEMQQLNEQMQGDQVEIERLKAETRLVAMHSDQLLLQIEAQLDALRKAA